MDNKHIIKIDNTSTDHEIAELISELKKLDNDILNRSNLELKQPNIYRHIKKFEEYKCLFEHRELLYFVIQYPQSNSNFFQIYNYNGEQSQFNNDIEIWKKYFYNDMNIFIQKELRNKVLNVNEINNLTECIVAKYKRMTKIIEDICVCYNITLKQIVISFEQFWKDNSMQYVSYIFTQPISVMFIYSENNKPSMVDLNEYITKYITNIYHDHKKVCDIHFKPIKTNKKKKKYNQLNLSHDIDVKRRDDGIKIVEEDPINILYYSKTCLTICKNHRNFKYLINELFYGHPGKTKFEQIISEITNEQYQFNENLEKKRLDILEKYELENIRRIKIKLLLKIFGLTLAFIALLVNYLSKERTDESNLILSFGLFAGIAVAINEFVSCCKETREIYKSKENKNICWITYGDFWEDIDKCCCGLYCNCLKCRASTECAKYNNCCNGLYNCLSKWCDKRKDFDEEKKECEFDENV